MNIPLLNSRDVFVYPHEGEYLLYAPLSSTIGLVSEEDVLSLERNLSKGVDDETLNEILSDSEESVVQVLPWAQQPELTILLNQKCNFSCSYCYSKDGRDQTVLSWDIVKEVLNRFISPSRGRSLSIVFSGGGDPILSFDIFRQAVLYARQLADSREINVEIGIVTNGSTLKQEYIDFIKDNKVDLVVSCDILKDVHNKQRSHFDVVAATIDHLCEQGMQVGLRSTITPLNVDRMVEMVEELHRRFPKVQGAAFEPVLNRELFPSVSSLRAFYDSFVTEIFKAVERGEQLGVKIGNTIINNVDTNKIRACLGKIVVTPRGELTACSRLSSPKESHYEDFCYGKVTETEGFLLDNERYQKIISHDVKSHKECQACLAKYHCSGGCLLARKSLPGDYIEAYCHFNREMVKRVLLSKCEI